MTESSRPIAPHEVLSIVENFHAKCASGKTLKPDEVDEFYHTIVQGAKVMGKERSLVGTVPHDASTSAKIMRALQKLKVTLGQNKAVLENAAAAVSYPQVEKALTSLEAYLKKEEEESRKVSRKEKPSRG